MTGGYLKSCCQFLQGEYIISTRVRCGRSLQGYPFNPCLTEAQYKEMEEKVSSTLSGLEGELKGQFYPLTGMTKEVQQKLIDDHFLFKEGDRFLQVGRNLKNIDSASPEGI
jgi:creatine kinase